MLRRAVHQAAWPRRGQVHGTPGLQLGRLSKAPQDLLRQPFGNLCVSGHGLHNACSRIHPERVPRPLSLQNATVLSQMAE